MILKKMGHIKFLVYNSKLEEQSVEVKDKNRIPVMFYLQYQLINVRKKLKRLQDKNIIVSIKRTPRVSDFRYKKKVEDLTKARRSIMKALIILDEKIRSDDGTLYSNKKV